MEIVGGAFIRLFFVSSCSCGGCFGLGQKFQKPPWYKILLIPTYSLNPRNNHELWVGCDGLASVREDAGVSLSLESIYFYIPNSFDPHPLISITINTHSNEMRTMMTHSNVLLF